MAKCDWRSLSLTSFLAGTVFIAAVVRVWFSQIQKESRVLSYKKMRKTALRMGERIV
jgi:hypothetical protein